MISYKADGYTLQDGMGNTATPIDWVKYSVLLQTLNLQQDAMNKNNSALNQYHTTLNNAQLSVNAGRGENITAPVKPLQIVVDDNGVTTNVAFNPPLADLMPLQVTTPNAGTIKATTNLPPDKLDTVIQLLMQLLSRGK